MGSHNTDILRNSEFFFFISVGRPRHPPSKMPVTKYYYPDVNLTLTAKYTDNKSLANVSKTRFEETNVQSTFSNRKFCQAHQIGSDELHSVSYITEKGDKIWIKMDASRPCKFNTTETRFYKPKLHTLGY